MQDYKGDNRQLLLVYCDEPSHTPDPVGMFVQAPDHNPNQDGIIGVELGRKDGLYIVAWFWRYPNVSRRWAPEMRTIRGLSKRGGGLQNLPRHREGPLARLQTTRSRWRLKCDWCDLTHTAIEPDFSDRLSALAEQDIVAVSLRALIDHR
jgi:hypothetical protein